MKRIILLSILLGAWGFNRALADIIYVQGDVSGTWSADTVIVTGEVRVPPEETLIIEPGVSVLFQVYCQFIVDSAATLLAVGTEQDSIRFDELTPGTHWRGIRFLSASSSCSLEYCRLSNGLASGSGDDLNGGAVFCSSSSLTICRNTISGNSATMNGGGIYCMDSNPSITGNTLCGNSANYGGGIACYYYSNPSIKGNILSGNSTTTSSGGGIGCYENSSPSISGNIISGNSASAYGGGIDCSSFSPTISGNTLSGNSAYGDGGGIYCYYSSPAISGNTLSGNSATYGGGIYFNGSSPGTVEFNEISGNTASGNGGGIYLNDSSPTMNKNTVAGNSAALGGGLYSTSSAPLLNNCILWGNAPQQIYQTLASNVQATYSDIQGFWPGTGNINQDPLFVNASAGDYHLQAASPCIDAGDPNVIYNDPDFTRADMGCYYFDQGLANPVSITLTPENPPIQIPAEGGSFNYTIEVTNSGSIPQMATIFCDVTLPSGAIFGPLLGPVSVTLAAGQVLSRLRTQNVPAGAPAGTYSYNGYAVVFRDTVTGSFPFEKLGADGSDWTSGWDNWGESLEAQITQDAQPCAPTEFALYPCYPNPFNASTTIRFDLSEATWVRLEVFDVAGRLVGARHASPLPLVNGWREAGSHEVTFDGSGLPSGVYIYRIEAGEFEAAGKVILLK